MIQSHTAISLKRGDFGVIERGETLLKRNVGHVKRFIEPAPQTPQSQKEGTWPQEPTSVREPVIVTDPKPITGSPVEGPVTKPVAEPSLPQSLVVRMSEQSGEPRVSMGRTLSQAGLKTMLLERLSQHGFQRLC